MFKKDVKFRMQIFITIAFFLFSVNIKAQIAGITPEKHFFDISFKTLSSVEEFKNLALKVEGIEDIQFLISDSEKITANVFVKNNYRATPDFIENFCLKSGVNEVFIDDHYVGADQVSEAIVSIFQKHNRTTRER